MTARGPAVMGHASPLLDESQIPRFSGGQYIQSGDQAMVMWRVVCSKVPSPRPRRASHWPGMWSQAGQTRKCRRGEGACRDSGRSSNAARPEWVEVGRTASRCKGALIEYEGGQAEGERARCDEWRGWCRAGDGAGSVILLGSSRFRGASQQQDG